MKVLLSNLADFMSLIKIKNKYQITIPTPIRKKAGIEVGDLVEAEVKDSKIVLTPKALIDRWLKKSLDGVKAGKTVGPFKSEKELFKSLDKK